jgi:nitroreductase
VDAIEAIHTRQSIRNFKEKEVSGGTIATILDCATKAPSSGNKQPWEFIIIKDQKVKEKIALLGARSLYERKKAKLKDSKENFEKIARAPIFVVVACDTLKSPAFWKHDGSACTQNILLSANALGVGSVWLGAPVALDKFSNQIKKMLKIPKSYGLASIVALGYPSKIPRKSSRKNLKDKVHYEEW